MLPLRAVHVRANKSFFPPANAQLNFIFALQHVSQFQLLGSLRVFYRCVTFYSMPVF